jgi:hypothetical protein
VAILGGAGCESAHAEPIAVAERSKAPIVHALRGKEVIEYDNPFDDDRTAWLFFRLPRDDGLRYANSKVYLVHCLNQGNLDRPTYPEKNRDQKENDYWNRGECQQCSWPSHPVFTEDP